MEKTAIVDENDKFLFTKDRSKLTYEDIYRVSALWLTNSKGQVLLSQRKLNEKHDPGKWGPAAAGTLEGQESYEDNLLKESQEEIGLTGVRFSLGPKQFSDTGEHKFFVQWFLSKSDRDIADFITQETEVEQIAWMSLKELRRELKDNPSKFVPSAKTWLGILI